MATLEIRGELGRRVTIEARGYENEHADNYYDANWLRCSVLLDLGQFHGEADASFLAADFGKFLSELEQVLDGEERAARFQTLEDALNLIVELDRAGRAVISGTLRESAGSPTALSFRFESDQSYLAPACAQLRKLVADFPEKQQEESNE